jgi:polar amino acid transport system substrate-binding protein
VTDRQPDRRFFLQTAVALGLGAALPAHAAPPLRMAYFETYSPLSFGQDGQLRGILLDIIQEVAGRRLGLVVEHTGYPWNRAQALVQTGEQDAICTIATPERLEYAVAAQEPVVSAPRRIFVHKDNAMLAKLQKVRNLDELHKLNPNVISYQGNGWAKTNMAHFKTDHGRNFDSAIKMLLANRGDLMVDNALTMQYALQQAQGSSDVLMMDADLETSHFQLLVGKKSPHVGMLPAFDTALRQFKRSPDYAKVLQKYGVKL